ncbi:hypothetical protein M1614_02100 [Candidatus Marsarchaeota archaeon]|nr:hypothetical protein [Candidatus Marsarchaeota archaeon]MCL5089755.1 hypothetical protein [Candidatus Marsarchaeota archaeon]
MEEKKKKELAKATENAEKSIKMVLRETCEILNPKVESKVVSEIYEAVKTTAFAYGLVRERARSGWWKEYQVRIKVDCNGIKTRLKERKYK